MISSVETYPHYTNVLSEEFLSKYRGRHPKWGFNGLGYIVFKRTYARMKLDGTTEEWWETVERCVRGAQKIGAQYTREEAERLYDHVFNLRCNFAGRMLWQLGTDTVDRFGLPSLCNCWWVNINEPEAFCFLFEHLMLGGGVGFSVRREDVHELPKIKDHVIIECKNTKDADFIVPDSREGWVELLRKILESYFVTGKSFSYSTILIRGSGEKINGFGGTASGPQILIDGLTSICGIFNKRIGKKLRSIDVLDICNILGSIVVSGNVRRSAQIAIGDADDKLFLMAKRWDLGNIPNWRAMSNNTIGADDYSYLSNDFWAGYNGDGEAYGLFNRSLCERYGRLIDGPMSKCDIYPRKKDNISGANPCAEANLEHGEPCDLGELYIHNIDSVDVAIDCAKLVYKTQKAILTLPSISKWTNEVVKRNMRIGLGVTGICEDLSKIGWLDQCYRELRKFDKIWSKIRGWAECIKMSVIKPSGTLSLLAGCTPGGHPAYARYFIRRIRMASGDSLVAVCRNLGCHIEYVKKFDGSDDYSTVVVEFPCESSETAVLAENCSAIEQLEIMKTLQTVWADQSVSVTVYYKKEELADIKNWLKDNYEQNVKTVSFLLHNDHGFKQAPYETISRERYQELSLGIKPISSVISGYDTGGSLDVQECAGGACPIK
jgi:ribonucleoside-triphosphate reductase